MGKKKRMLEGRSPGSSAPSLEQRLVTVVQQYCILENDVEVTLTNEAMSVEQWISSHMAESFGLDVEWKPTFKKGARENPVALLQLSTLRHCLLIQMQRLATIPEGLKRLLAAPEVALAGVGVREDLRKLWRDFSLECSGAVELAGLAGEVLGRPELAKAGLRALALAVLRKEWVKSKRVTMSNWEQDLDRHQIAYAATDAWVSHAVHQALRKHHRGRSFEDRRGATTRGQGGSREAEGTRDAEAKPSIAVTQECTVELAFAREVKRRRIDVNPHGAFLEERRRSGQGTSPRAGGARAAERDLRERLQKRQGEAEGALRGAMLDRKRARDGSEANVSNGLRQGPGSINSQKFDDGLSTAREAFDEGETVQITQQDHIGEGVRAKSTVRGKATSRNGHELTPAQLARRRKKERHRKYGGKKTVRAS